MGSHPKSKKEKAPQIEYHFRKPLGIYLTVKSSANAWWMDENKVGSLLFGFYYGCKVHEACSMAGITAKQYKYFLRLHPEFREIKEECEAKLVIEARITIANAINNGDVAISQFYLERKRRYEFGKKIPETEPYERLEPITLDQLEAENQAIFDKIEKEEKERVERMEKEKKYN